MISDHDVYPTLTLNMKDLFAQRESLVTDPSILGFFLEREGFLGVLDPDLRFLVVNHKALSKINPGPRPIQHGQRPGEILGCAHYNSLPGACGTLPACQSCQLLKKIRHAAATPPGEKETISLSLQNGSQMIKKCLRISVELFEKNGVRYTCLFAEETS
jgi:hypothetical protein